MFVAMRTAAAATAVRARRRRGPMVRLAGRRRAAASRPANSGAAASGRATRSSASAPDAAIAVRSAGTVSSVHPTSSRRLFARRLATSRDAPERALDPRSGSWVVESTVGFSLVGTLLRWEPDQGRANTPQRTHAVTRDDGGMMGQKSSTDKGSPHRREYPRIRTRRPPAWSGWPGTGRSNRSWRGG